MGTLTVKELAAPSGFDLKVASGETLDLNSQGTIILPTIPVGKMPSKSILQVVSSNVDANSTTTSTTFSATDASITITPSSTSSTMLISYHGGRTGFAGSGGGDGAIKIYKSVGGGSYSSVEGSDRGVANFYGFGDFYGPASLQWIDSPSTTSQLVYKIYIARRSGSGTFSLSRDGSQAQNMTVMEVSG